MAGIDHGQTGRSALKPVIGGHGRGNETQSRKASGDQACAQVHIADRRMPGHAEESECEHEIANPCNEIGSERASAPIRN